MAESGLPSMSKEVLEAEDSAVSWQCLHIICTKLVWYQTTQACHLGASVLQCPVCRDITDRSPADLCVLPLDLVLSALVNDDGNEIMRCTCCKRALGVKAAAQCYTCDDVICKTCRSFFGRHEV